RNADAPRLQVRCTLNRLNFRDFDVLMDFWQAHADNVLLQVVQDNCLHEVRDRSCLFQPDDRPEFERLYAGIRARYPFLKNRYYETVTEAVKSVFQRRHASNESTNSDL